MARSTYAIRHGFEYQDLYCAYQLLQYTLTNQLDARFEIESDQVAHVDDLITRPTSDVIEGHQVKFHVDQDHAESFDSLTERKTSKSTSLLQKLYKAWKTISSTGCSEYRLIFVSSNPAERGRYKLGPALDTKSGHFNEKFFSHNDYAKWRSDLTAHLKTDANDLRAFLTSVVWRFSYESIDGLRRLVIQALRQLKLPHDEDAVARLMEVVGHIATTPTGEQTVRSFIQELWKTSRFRDACEQRFPSIDFGVGQVRRANRIRVASVSLEVLPAFFGTRYSCLEEPIPFPDYRRGITATDTEALLDDYRTLWRQEYLDWLNKKVGAVLDFLAQSEIDLLVFSRFTLPLETASLVAKWGKDRGIHCIVGGHSLPQSSAAHSLYQADLNVPVEVPHQEDGTEVRDLVVDPVLRHDRVGRASISQLDSPFASKESVYQEPEPVQLLGRDGWITTILLPSLDAAQAYLNTRPGRPELVVVSAGVHASEICDSLTAQQLLDGCPVIAANPNLYSLPSAFIAEKGTATLQQTDAWEGVVFLDVAYDRSAVAGWTAEIHELDRVPLVYSDGDPDLSGEGLAVQKFRGTRACRDDAARRIQTNQQRGAVTVKAEDGAYFFYRRGSQAREVVRSSLAKASTDQIIALSETLKVLEKAVEDYRKLADLPDTFSPTPPRPLPVRVARFHDRAREKEAIGRFLEGAGGKRLLVLHGPPGIGKKDTLAEVQRLSADRDKWIRFRCTPNSRLAETFAQFLVRLGVSAPSSVSLDRTFYGNFLHLVLSKGYTVAVLEDTHFLPLSDDHPDHAAFLDFLAFQCSDSCDGKVRVILVSDWRGKLQFSGSHRMEPLRIEGLDREYVVEMLQEHLAMHASRYQAPTVDELVSIASKLHGHPYVTKIASVVLESSPAPEVIEKLYSRIETRQFIMGRLLGRIKLTDQEQRFLELASILRIPVSSEAFAVLGGSSSHALVEELLDRFLLVGEDNRVRLHPVLAEFFSIGLNDAEYIRRLHNIAFGYFENISKRRQMTVDERVEYVYHGISCGKPIDFGHMQAFAGSVRTALTEGVRNRDWAAVEAAAKQLLAVWPYESVGQIGMALALEGTGREHEANQYLDCLENVTVDNLGLAIEFVRNRIRRRDFDGAERALAILSQRYGGFSPVILAEAQLFERRGETDKAVAACEKVLQSQGVREHEVSLAGLILRDANRSDIFVRLVEPMYERGIRNEGVIRLFGLACVVTNYDPQTGLELLSQLWDASPNDGFVVADYSTALRAAGRVTDANAVLSRGFNEVPRQAKGRRPLLEAQAEILEREERFTEAFAVHRELVNSWPTYLHLHRRYASCLLAAAAHFKAARDSAREDSAVNEAKAILTKLLQIAPLDKWASDALHSAEVRAY
jgi:tetratricopeptide (TPR) repeat protein